MNNNQKDDYVYDIEQYRNYHCSVWFSLRTKKLTVFQIHSETTKEELREYMIFLTTKIQTGIGFNNLRYDSRMLDTLVKNIKPDYTGDFINKQMKEVNDRILNIKDWYNNKTENIFRNLDLFKIHHYDNLAKSQSLKGLQFEMGWKSVQETPIHFDAFVKKKDRQVIIDYCINDVMSCYEFFKISLPKIKLRKKLSAKYNLDFTNDADSTIGEKLFLKLYCDKTGLSAYEVKKLSTTHETLNFSDLLLPFINFKTPEYQEIHSAFKQRVYMGHKDFRMQKTTKGITYVFGLGGIHASRTGVFESDEDYVIRDCDVSGYYPSIPISHKFYITHLGEVYLEVLENDIVKPRKENKKKIKDLSYSEKERKDFEVESDGLKLSGNSIYGKSSQDGSYLKDISYTYKTTLNGQLSLLMLIEEMELTLMRPFKVLQANTDGITFMIHRKDEDLFNYVCKEWEKVTKLELEYATYIKMFLRDVNNYKAITEEGKVKDKGAYEIIKKVGSETVYHKDSSFRILQIATHEYFVNDTPIEETIRNCTDIKHFLGRQKIKSDFKAVLESYENKSVFEEKQVQELEKVTRYYIAKSGDGAGRFVKIKKLSGQRLKVHDGYFIKVKQTLNENETIPNDINYQFYIDETIKLINAITEGERNMN